MTLEEEDKRAAIPADDSLQLTLEGFQGPLDLLLGLARRQRVDLSRISLIDLADQYVAAIHGIEHLDLNRAADWLVMAAWVTWLKSRLLLPQDEAEGKEADRAGKILRERLAQLARIREAVEWIEKRPQLGRDHFARGHFDLQTGPIAAATYVDLLEACLTVLRGDLENETDVLVIQARDFWTPAQAIAHMRAALVRHPRGGELSTYMPRLPSGGADEKSHRAAAFAATLLASLELTRLEEAEVRQDDAFGSVSVQSRNVRAAWNSTA